MSIAFAKVMKTVAAGVAAAGFLFVQQAVASDSGITRFAVRNCTHARVLVCTYNKDDSLLTLPYDVNKIQPSEKKRASCGSANRCKAFSVFSYEDIKKADILSAVMWGAGAGSVLGLGAGIALADAAGVYAVGLGPAGALAGAGIGIAVVRTFDAAEAGKTCERALKDTRKAIDGITDDKLRRAARDGLKRKLAGSWPKYKDYSLVNQNGVPVLVEGDKC